jgi:hypothetical protein
MVATRLEFERHLALHFEEDDLGIISQWQMVLIWQHAVLYWLVVT